MRLIEATRRPDISTGTCLKLDPPLRMSADFQFILGSVLLLQTNSEQMTRSKLAELRVRTGLCLFGFRLSLLYQCVRQADLPIRRSCYYAPNHTFYAHRAGGAF